MNYHHEEYIYETECTNDPTLLCLSINHESLNFEETLQDEGSRKQLV